MNHSWSRIWERKRRGMGRICPNYREGMWPRPTRAIIAESSPVEDRFCVSSEFTFNNCA